MAEKMTVKPCLVLTSTIKVDYPEFLKPTGRHQLELRRGDTEKALVRWVTRQQAIRDIVVVDNSGYPLDGLEALVDRHNTGNKRVEFISFRTDRYNENNGRSIGELDIFEKALDQSALLRDAGHVAISIARIFISNVDDIMSRMPADFDIVGRLSHNLTWFDSKFAVFRKDIFKGRILPYALQHVDEAAGNYIERVYAKATLRCISDDRRWYPFACEPLYDGICGNDNRPYPNGRLRAKIIDWFSRGYYRAFDISSHSHRAHPLESRQSTSSGATADGDDVSARLKAAALRRSKLP